MGSEGQPQVSEIESGRAEAQFGGSEGQCELAEDEIVGTEGHSNGFESV